MSSDRFENSQHEGQGITRSEKKKPRKNPPEGCCLRKRNIEGKRFNKCAYVRGDRNCSLLLPELMPKLLVLNRDRRQQDHSLDSAPARKNRME